MELGPEAEQLMTKMYRDKALDTFVRGLRGDLSRLLGMKEPADLPAALHLCLKLENQAFRANHATNRGQQSSFKNAPSRFMPQMQPAVPIWPQWSIPTGNAQFQTPFAQPNSNRQHYILHRQPFNGNQNLQVAPYVTARPSGSQPPPRPLAAKPQPRPEPMDIDRTLQTKQINYMNKPGRFDTGKRPPNPINETAKKSRNFNIQSATGTSTEVKEESPSLEDYEQTLKTQEETPTEFHETLSDFCDTIEQADQEYPYDYTIP